MHDLGTARLLIRRWTEDDSVPMHGIFSDPEAMRFWNTPLSASPEEMAGRIRWSREAPPEQHVGWAVVRRAGGEAIGFLNFHHRDQQNRRLEIGYILARPAWGQRYATEAVTALLDHCFGPLEANRVEATIDPANAASRRLAERLGFQWRERADARAVADARRTLRRCPDVRPSGRGLEGPETMTERDFYHEGMRALQDRFDGRRVADALADHRRRWDFWDEDRVLIETAPMFFIATSYGEYTDCSMRSGQPGFVKIVGPGTIEFPEYDGNSMYRTLGNISRNPNVGLLFVKFDSKSYRVRMNGRATILDDADALARHHAAKLVVRVVCDMFSNCPRSVHDLEGGRLSAYMPKPGYEAPAPEWKGRDYIRGILPAGDPHRAR
jgi:RimJ/RimL family protein N-acetyltransferase/predicted pyridoxine 5'-phosphate oxidase superfamily flavin-nucleotide-binding protein